MHTHICRLSFYTLAATMLLALPPASPAQEAAQPTVAATPSIVPHLIKYSGALPGAPNTTNTVDVKFALYAAQIGGEALWSETQQVSLDAAGKYSVLLGSVTALPDGVFAQGQARWIGVTLGSEEESARTILVATPYSLKASDAETLGGHPVSDFTLKNAPPASGTNITQINVSNGIIGGGTGPTVSLSLSNSFLESLGNEIYPQLGGNNILTGKNTFSAGKLLLGTSPVLSAASVTGTSPVTATVSGNGVKIGLDDTALLTLANGVYAQLNAANTFSTNQTVHSSAMHGIDSVDTGNGNAALYGADETGDSSGVTGEGDTGVFGLAVGGGNYNIGVLGTYPSFSNEFSTRSAAMTQNGVGTGTWGDGGNESAAGNGLIATSDSGNGIVAYNSSFYATIFAVSDYAGDSRYATLLDVTSSVTNGSCVIDLGGDIDCTGSYAVTNLTPDKRQIETYNVQSSENWIEDFGSGQLESGHAVVALDPTFAKIANTGVSYHVFLTPKGESENLYIANESASGFEVREAHGGSSAVAFDYRIVAKRIGKESQRLVDITDLRKNHNPSLLADMQAKHHQSGVATRPLPAVMGGVRMVRSAGKPIQP